MLNDTDPDVRWMAVWALAKVGGPAVPAMLQALQGPEKIVRQSAANALGWIADPAGVPALLAVRKDPDADLRRAAAEALTRYGHEIEPALLGALRSPNAVSGEPLPRCWTTEAGPPAPMQTALPTGWSRGGTRSAWRSAGMPFQRYSVHSATPRMKSACALRR